MFTHTHNTFASSRNYSADTAEAARAASLPVDRGGLCDVVAQEGSHMLAKLTILLQNKVAVAALGAVLIGGAGATAAAAATGHLPLTQTHATATAGAVGDHGQNGDNQGDHEVSLEGTLKAYDAAKNT